MPLWHISSNGQKCTVVRRVERPAGARDIILGEGLVTTGSRRDLCGMDGEVMDQHVVING